MSYPYPNPDYHYQTSNPNPPQQQSAQYGQSGQPLPNTYHSNQGQQGYSQYPEGSPHSQPSGQRQGSSSPYATPVSFPEPQRHGSRSPYSGAASLPEQRDGSAGSHQQAYNASFQATPDLTIPTQQHGRRNSHGHSPTSSQQLYLAGAGSDAGRSSDLYSSQPGVQSYHGGDYATTAAQPRELYAAGHEETQGHDPLLLAPGNPPPSSYGRPRSQGESAAAFDEESDTRSKGPPGRPASGSHPLCRYPRCTRLSFFDRRINELREWCSDQHMQAAIQSGVEKPCTTCKAWPRRNGRRTCSEVCRYRG